MLEPYRIASHRIVYSAPYQMADCFAGGPSVGDARGGCGGARRRSARGGECAAGRAVDGHGVAAAGVRDHAGAPFDSCETIPVKLFLWELCRDARDAR